MLRMYCASEFGVSPSRRISYRPETRSKPFPPEEVQDALRFVEICERGGGTPPEEADECRGRILARYPSRES